MGANVRWFALIAAMRARQGGLVYAFEPEPFNYAQLVRNCTINNVRNLLPVKAAVSDRQGHVSLYLSPTANEAHSLFRRTRAMPSIKVDQVSLDWYVKK